jgi:ATP-dependent Lon protease
MNKMKIPKEDIHNIGTVARILRVLKCLMGTTVILQGKKAF